MMLIIILYALLASTFSLGKVILAYTKPLFLVGIRMTIAGIILLGYQYLCARTKFVMKKEHWFWYLQIILCSIVIPYFLRYWGLQFMSTCQACLLYNLGPFVSYILCCCIAIEQLTIKKVVGLSIGFIGLLSLLYPQFITSTSWNMGLPNLALIVSISCMAYGWVIMHKLMKEFDYSAVMINAIGMTGGGLLSLILSYYLEQPLTTTIYTTNFLTLLTILIIVSNLICHNMYVSLLKYYSPTIISLASFLLPLFAALYGWLFLHETISWYIIIALFFIAAGLAIFYYDEKIIKFNLKS